VNLLNAQLTVSNEKLKEEVSSLKAENDSLLTEQKVWKMESDCLRQQIVQLTSENKHLKVRFHGKIKLHK